LSNTKAYKATAVVLSFLLKGHVLGGDSGFIYTGTYETDEKILSGSVMAFSLLPACRVRSDGGFSALNSTIFAPRFCPATISLRARF